jgi:outer membrane protein assembly factor BamB
MIKRLPVALLIFLFALTTVATAADEWSQFRGPNGTGVSETKDLPTEFGPTKNVVWKTELPAGHSSPVLTRNHVFVTAHNNDMLLVICLDRQTGKILWQREVPRKQEGRLQNVNGPASPSPVTDGTNVYAFFQQFGLISYDPAGKMRWQLPLGPFNIFYGFGASPILVDDKIILPVDQDHPSSYMLAVDKDTGRVRWKIERPIVISGYSTPTVYQPPQGPKQILVPESFQLSAYSVADGKRVWWVRGLACEMKSIASYDPQSLYINGWCFPQNQPGEQIKTIAFDEALTKYDKDKDQLVARTELAGVSAPGPMDKMLTAAFEAFDLDRDEKLNTKEWEVFRSMMAAENGLLAIKMGGAGDQTANAIRWRYQKPVPQVPSTLLYHGVLYMINDSGILISFDPATGKVIKQGRLHGAIDKYFSSPVAADDKVFLIGQAGQVSVLKAGGEWEVLAVNELDDECFATPAIADGRIYIRTRSALYCFGKEKPA